MVHLLPGGRNSTRVQQGCRLGRLRLAVSGVSGLTVARHSGQAGGGRLGPPNPLPAVRRVQAARDSISAGEGTMHQTLQFLGGVGLGAGLVYFTDPQWGRRRRAGTADQLNRLWHETGDALDVAARDSAHRARGLWAQARADGRTPDDRVLADRVRSRLGRFCSHPHAITAAADGGTVTLTGPILAHEVSGLLCAVKDVPGVTGVENRLEEHRQAGNIPDLQGGGPRPGMPGELNQNNWAPAVRLAAGAAGMGLMANCLARRDPVSILLGTAGFGLFLRAATNTPVRHLVGATGSRAAVTVQKALIINAPAEHVFPFFARYDTFPEYMRHVRAVRDLGNGRSHWSAAGPAGVPVSWDAVVTRFEPNRLIAWRSEPGSTIANAGVIRFDPEAGGRTRVTIRLSYTPPGGALGHFAARLFGRDVRAEMDEDLVRLKGLIETGKASAPGKGQVSAPDVVSAACPA
jgi:uncharacterized membrane protein